MRSAASRRVGRLAFTLVELIVASLIATTALIGIYEVLQQVAAAERRTTQRWTDHAAAEAVVAELAHAVEHAIQFTDLPCIEGGDVAGGSTQLILNVASSSPGDSRATAPIRRRRYLWSNLRDSATAGALLVQTIDCAGARDISNSTAARPGLMSEEVFADVPHVSIAQGIDKLTVRFRYLDASNRWSDRYRGDGAVLVWITVRSGTQEVERFARPRVTGKLLGHDE